MSRGHFGVALQVAERVKTSSVSFGSAAVRRWDM
jgi:hypothetical protein